MDTNETTTEITNTSMMDLQKILLTYGFKVENLGGICPKCGRFYRVHFYNEKTIEEIDTKRFRCRDCFQAELRNK